MSNPKGPNKSRFLQKVKEQADDSKNLRCETLYISDYECITKNDHKIPFSWSNIPADRMRNLLCLRNNDASLIVEMV